MSTKLELQKEIDILKVSLNEKSEQLRSSREQTDVANAENRLAIRNFKAIEKNWSEGAASRKENDAKIRTAMETHCALEYPGMRLAGQDHGPFSLNDKNVQEIAQELRSQPMAFRFLSILHDMLEE